LSPTSGSRADGEIGLQTGDLDVAQLAALSGLTGLNGPEM